MKKLLISLIAFALFVPASTVFAATMRAGEDVGLNSADTVSENYYAVGAINSLSGKVDGDAYVAGGMINIIGAVRDDLVVAGGNITVTGPVGQDLRVVGGNIVVSNNIGGEITIAGGTVQLLGSQVAGNAYVAGGLININSNVNGNLKVAGGQVTINGEVTGNVEVQASEKLIIGSNANIHGTIIYKGVNEAEIATGAKLASAIQFEKVDVKDQWKGTNEHMAKENFVAFLLGTLLVKILIMIVSALLLIALMPKCTNQVINATFAKYWVNTLYGLVVAIVAPILAVLLLITVIGSVAGMAVGLVYGLLMLLAKIIAAILVGVWIMKKIGKGKEVPLNWKPVVIGSVVMGLLMVIPLIGWLVACLVFLAALGALSMHSYETILAKQK